MRRRVLRDAGEIRKSDTDIKCPQCSDGLTGVPSNFTWRSPDVGELRIEDNKVRRCLSGSELDRKTCSPRELIRRNAAGGLTIDIGTPERALM
jgi:hypothetical protein